MEVEQLRIAGLVVENTVALLVQVRTCSRVAALLVEHYMVIALEEPLAVVQAVRKTVLGIQQ